MKFSLHDAEDRARGVPARIYLHLQYVTVYRARQVVVIDNHGCGIW
jgi:hypothetical protein